jgi:hypothetical protein
MTLFLKGYRLDLSKIRNIVPIEPNKRPDDWVIPIVETIPRDAYKCVQNGYESNNRINVIIVTEDGADEQELMKSPVASSDEVLAEIGRAICTPGIWPSFDSAFYLPNSNSERGRPNEQTNRS